MTKIVGNFIKMDNYIYCLTYVRMNASNSDLLKTIKSNPRKPFKRDCKIVGFDLLQAGINKYYKT